MGRGRCRYREDKGNKRFFFSLSFFDSVAALEFVQPRTTLPTYPAAASTLQNPEPIQTLSVSLSLSLSLSHAHTHTQLQKQVWKTYLGRNRGTGTLKAVGEIYRNGGVSAFWAGTGAKMVESASKGLILMYSKESLLRVFEKAHVSPGKRIERWRKRRRGGGERGGGEKKTRRGQGGAPLRRSTFSPLTEKKRG